MVHVTIGIVWPSLSNIQVFDKRARISSPELLCWNKSSWWHYGPWCNLRSIFYSSSFKDNTFVSNHNIISNMAGVESAVRPNGGVSSDVELGLHSCWQRWGGVEDAVLSNWGELANLNTVDIASNYGVVPDGGESLELNLTYDSSWWGDPIIFGSRGDIVQIQLHLMLWILFNCGYLSYTLFY